MSALPSIGLVLVVLCAGFMWREHQIILKSQITEGRVIGLELRRGSKGSRSYAPKVQFVTPDGRAVTFVTRLSSSSPGVKAGDSVPVAYDPLKPEGARLLLFAYRFGIPYILIGVGFVLMFIGYGYAHGDAWIQARYLSPSAGILTR